VNCVKIEPGIFSVSFLQLSRNQPFYCDGGAMEVTTKQFKHCDLVSVKGRVDSATAPKLSEALDAIANESRFKVVIDMQELEYMSSAGFRALIAAQRNCKRFNRGEVVLTNVPENIHSALELAGFTALFKIFKDVTSAVGSF
jgi:anti-sigma B factor antagonist